MRGHGPQNLSLPQVAPTIHTLGLQHAIYTMGVVTPQIVYINYSKTALYISSFCFPTFILALKGQK